MPIIPGFVASNDQPYGPQVTFRSQDILPPAAVYLGKDDTVVLNVRSPGTTAALDVDIRFLDPQGVIKPMQFQQSVNTTGTTATEFTLFQAEGFLLSASIFGTAVSRGQTFVKLYVKRGVGSSDTNNGPLLMQGYVSADDWLSYPTSPTESCLNGRGWNRIVTTPSPGANLPIEITVPAGVRWIVRTASSSFFCDAAVGARNPFIVVIDDTATTVCTIPSVAACAGPSLNFLTWAPGLNPLIVGTQQSMGFLMELILPQLWTLRISSNFVGAGDGFIGMGMLVEQFVGQ